MSKKQIEISKLMDSYTDDEFNIEGTESARLSEVRNKVMEQVQNKKHLKLSKKILIIAAAVVGVSAITAATLPYGFFKSQTGGEYGFREYGTDISEPTGNEVPPYTVRDDRVYLTVNDENVDITDKIGEDRFYFYQYTDTDNQDEEVICVYAVCRDSGSEDGLGYGEFVYKKRENSFFTNGAGSMYGTVTPYCYYKDGEVIMINKEDEDYEAKKAEYTKYPHRCIRESWMIELSEKKDEWYRTVSSGETLDVSKTDTSIDAAEEIDPWMYPEGWTGEYVPEGV